MLLGILFWEPCHRRSKTSWWRRNTSYWCQCRILFSDQNQTRGSSNSDGCRNGLLWFNWWRKEVLCGVKDKSWGCKTYLLVDSTFPFHLGFQNLDHMQLITCESIAFFAVGLSNWGTIWKRETPEDLGIFSSVVLRIAALCDWFSVLYFCRPFFLFLTCVFIFLATDSIILSWSPLYRHWI